mmetsp:Transcript_21957/g.32886  ORF Transcript_21957/g.32886 Transcript_21957/m.32886 type:complete len:86 (+) Transcript_21957:354-611(+)
MAHDYSVHERLRQTEGKQLPFFQPIFVPVDGSHYPNGKSFRRQRGLLSSEVVFVPTDLRDAHFYPAGVLPLQGDPDGGRDAETRG